MLTLRQMDNALADKLGVASKAIAAKAASQGSGTLEECAARAEKRLKYGMDQSADVLRAYLD
jgi:hypothetical protein